MASLRVDTAYASLAVDSGGNILSKTSELQPNKTFIQAKIPIPDKAGTVYTELGDFPGLLGMMLLYVVVFLAGVRRDEAE